MLKQFTIGLIANFLGSVVVLFAVFAKASNIPFPYWDIIIYGSAIVALAGAIWNSVEQNIFQNKIETLTNSNLEKSDKIIELNTYINNSITGGDSIPYVYIDSSIDHPNKLNVSIRVKGEFPLYDVQIEIQHVGRKILFNAGNISNKYISNLGVIELPEEGRKFYLVQIYCRNGVFHQRISLEKRRYLKGHESWGMKKSVTYHSKDIEFKNPIDEFESEESPSMYTVVE